MDDIKQWIIEMWLQEVSFSTTLQSASQCYHTFQSNEFWAVEVDHSQQSCAVRHVLQQVVQ